MIIWLVGLSGSGKSTIGKALYQRWRASDHHTVLLDGDAVRRACGADRLPADYTVAGRRRNGERMVQLCEAHDAIGRNVVCCILSIFPDMRSENRTRFSRYFEVHVRASMETVSARDTKGLYRGAREGRVTNVVGVDIPFEPPSQPDVIVDTDPGSPSATVAAASILDLALSRRAARPVASSYTYTQRDRLEDRNTYFYSAYHGPALLEDWRRDRTRLGDRTAPMPHGEAFALPEPGTGVDLRRLLHTLVVAVHSEGVLDRRALWWLLWVVRKFEVSKRLFPEYGADLVAHDRANYGQHDLYVRTAELVECAYVRTGELNFLNCLLKLDDTLVSVGQRLAPSMRKRAARVLLAEQRHIQDLARRLEVST
ncbi:MAG: adenylyl-sulfate kinase [Nannocystaceae bacterium]